MKCARSLAALVRHSYHGLTPVLAAAVLAYTLVGVAWSKLYRDQVYPEILLSGIAMGAIDKDRDLRTLDLFLAATAVLALGLGGTLRLLTRENPGGEVGSALTTLLTIALLPACWRLGDALIRAEGHLWPKESALCILGVWVVALGLLRHRSQLTGPLVLQLGGATLLSLALACFDGLGVATAVGRLWPACIPGLQGKARWFFLAPLLLTGAVTVWLYAATAALDTLRRRLYGLVLVVQIPLPLLFFVLIPPPLQEAGDLRPDQYSWRLPALLGALAVASWCLLYRRYRRWAESESQPGSSARDLHLVLSPLVLAAVSLFLLMPTLAYPQAFLADRFHEAEESALFWRQWRDFGLRPYADLIPIHGLMSLGRGLLNDVFFDGTMGQQAAAELLILTASVLATFLTLSAVASPLVALFVSFACPVGSRAYFLAPAVLLLIHPRLRQRPRLWLGVWTVVGAVSVFYNGAIGPALVLGTSPAAAWMGYRVWIEDRVRGAGFLLAGTLVLLLVFAAQPLRDISIGLVTFLNENRGTHALGNGVSWEEGKAVPIFPRDASESSPLFARDFVGSRFLFELFRFSWILVVFVALARLWHELALPPTERHSQTVWLSVLLVPTLLLCSRWVVGTIDPGAASRTGILSHLCWLYFVPLLLLARCGVLNVVRGLAALAVVITAFNALEVDDHVFRSPQQGAVGATEYHALGQKPFAVRMLPTGHQAVDGGQIGLPFLGRVALKPEHLATLLELKDALQGLLQPGETFLDLTNSPIYYYYLGLPVPTLYAGDFAIVNRQQQRRSLKRLGPQPPAVVLAGPPGMYPFNITSVRSYPLYREFLLRYQPVQRGRFTFLVDPQRRPEVTLLPKATAFPLLDQLFQWKGLVQAAAAWGGSWRSLACHFEPIGQLDLDSPGGVSGATVEADGWLRPTAGAPRVSYRLGATPVNGAEADYVKIDLEVERVPQAPDPWLALSWESDEGSTCSPLWIAASRPTLLVPLGGTPSWLLNPRLRLLHLTLLNPASCTRFRIQAVELLHLKGL